MVLGAGGGGGRWTCGVEISIFAQGEGTCCVKDEFSITHPQDRRRQTHPAPDGLGT